MRKSRESNFELLRIVAMFMIVLYHLLMRYSYTDGHLIYRVLQFPLHIGVILFVLISGYYGIRPSIRGLMRLLAPVVVLYLSIELIYSHIKSGGGKCGMGKVSCSHRYTLLVYKDISLAFSGITGNK